MSRGKWDFKADEWTDVATKQSKQSRNTAILETTKGNKQKDGFICCISKADNDCVKRRHSEKAFSDQKDDNRLHAFSSRWTWKILNYYSNFILFFFKNADVSRWLPVHCNQRARCSQLASSCKQSVECRGSALTVMTDTPAVVLLSLGPVLKCFLIFPATDSWCSFSDTPTSWKLQTKLQHPGRAPYSRSSACAQVRDTYIDPRVIQHLHGGVPLVHFDLQHSCDQSLKKMWKKWAVT